MIPRRPPNPTIVHPERVTLAADTLPAPALFGLPDKFDRWRPGQCDAVARIIDSPERFLVLAQPTGSGKSISAASSGVLSGLRTVILTSTRGLQDQYQATIGDAIHDVRGMGNYRCPIAVQCGLPVTTTVSDAPCSCGYQCRLRFSGDCEYFARYHVGRQHSLVVSNYQCWFYDGMKSPDDALHVPGPAPNGKQPPIVDLLICDEATQVAEELTRFVGIHISRRDCLQLRLGWPHDDIVAAADAPLMLENWRTWAKSVLGGLMLKVDDAEEELRRNRGRSWSRDLKLMRDMGRKLDKLAHMQASDQWVMDEQHEDEYGRGDVVGVTFSPLDPSRFAEQALWRGVGKIVLMSATVRPKHAQMLGIRADEMSFVEYPSTFDARRRPIYVIPTVMLNYRTEQDDNVMRRWLDRIDGFIAPRISRKGIIHAVSYTRAKFLKDNSQFGQHMFVHGRGNRAEVIERFKRWPAPAILVSPSVDTGYDFPADQARFVIVGKLPFQSVSDKLVKARQRIDPEYQLLITADTLQQMTGRGMRSEQDWCETAIVDDAFGNWFFHRAKRFFNDWWLESLVWTNGLPEMLEIA